MCDQSCQSFALFPGRSDPWIRLAKPGESCVKKFIGGRGLSTGALSVERPAKNNFCRTIMFSSYSPQPMVDQRWLPDTGPSPDGNDVDLRVRPGGVQKRD